MRVLKVALKFFIYTVTILLLLFAFGLQVIRTCLFFIDDHHIHVERFLSERLSSDVSLDSIKANWHGLRPSIEVSNLKVVSRIDASIIEASDALVVLDLSDTFFQFAPVFKHVRFSDLTLSLSQNEQGAWGVAGFLSSGERPLGTWRYRSPADLFSTVQFAELNNTQLKLQFFDGRVLDTVFPYTDITNDGDNHYLNISAAVEGEADVFSIRIEGIGRPSQPDDFKAKALVAFNQFPAERLSRLLLLDNALEIDEFNSATLDGKFWFDFDTTRHFSMSGDFAFSGSRNTSPNDSPLEESDNAITVKNFADIYQVPLTAAISADYQFNKGLTLNLQNIQVDNAISLMPIKMTLENKSVKLRTEKVALEPLSTWFVSRFTPTTVTQFISGMAPRGELHHVQLSGELGDASSLHLRAHANALGINHYRVVPQFEQVTGFIDTTINKGSLLLDTQNFSMAVQPFFKQAFTAQTARGEISWHLSPADNRVSIQGKDLSATATFGRVNAFFDLDLPWQPNTIDSHLNLQLGIEDSSAEYTELFLPTILSSDLRQWISAAVKQGDVNTAGVFYRGGFNADSDRAVQLYLDVDNGQLAYQPEWPALDNVSAEVIFDDDKLIARVAQASTYDAAMTGLITWNDQSKERLSIQANIDSSAQSALRFVENSPLKQQVGDTFSDWDVEGNTSIGIDLLFGLGDDNDFSSQLAEINLSDNRLYLPEQDLEISNANGTVFYSSENGFSSSQLNGILFGEQTLLEMNSQENGDLLLTGSGGVDIASVSSWLEQPLLSSVSKGLASYTFDFLISDSDTVLEPVQKLSIYSDLNNVSINLPPPFAKAPSESKDFVLEAKFKGDVSHYAIQLDDTLYTDLTFTGEDRFTSFVQLSDQPFVYTPKALPTEARNDDQGLFIYGDFNALNVESWLPFVETLNATDDDSSDSFAVFYDVKATALEFMDSSVSNASILGYNNSDIWENTIASDSFAGNVYYRQSDEVPLTINLDYLLVEKEETLANDEAQIVTALENVTATADPFADIDFNDIPSAAISIKYFEYDDKPLGAWSFDVDAQVDAITVQNIQGVIADLELTGITQGEGGRLRWSRDQGQDQTTLVARVKGGDLKTVFELWDLPASIINQQTHAAINIAWAGSPAALTVASLNGDVDFLLEDGVFAQVGDGATGFLRVLSFLNFDTWVKRLRLNFSGILDNGMAFDNVSGRLNFNEGIIQLDEPVEVNGDAVSISLSGSIDYPQDNIDGNLAVVLPVGGNLNLAAALAAGLPAAVGIYLVRQIFKDALRKASTVNYSVSGSLNKPEVKFYRGADK